MRSSRRDAGFTLLELLVALTVLGFILVGLMQGLRFGLSAWGLQAPTISARDEIGATERLFRGLIERMEPGGEDDPPVLQGLPGALRFRTRMPMAAALLRFRDVEAAFGVDGQRALVLRLRPNPRAALLVATPPVIEETLIEGVDRIELAYWRMPRRGQDGGWQRQWTTPELPGLVRLRIVFPAGDRRRWPDIVAAPMLETAAK